ncbi:hypothetical protein [Bifidobacterium oedipodis]|uniref:Uncharacterized protein n=1 Tax=Bifidobacterium oedipodis TaxID=2675322 RepID=A0A7Y0HTM4_9BIFI|nr:hypothetical protein [Bifidobacterium sp. DSM 109957]NMM95251.1 hypothetical protein [Bifidobacterium sp. DSM 109957]
MKSTWRPILDYLQRNDRSEIWLLLAIVALPVDGTTLGIYAPFWSPISPALFAVYCACNWRLLRLTMHRYATLFAIPVVLVVLSMPGWTVFGLHANAAFMSLTGVLGALCTLAALDIAFERKRLDWRPLVGLLIAAYWFAFAVGVVQWVAIRLGLTPITNYFQHLMYRPYLNADSPWGGGRPQFLFAEPSYIGMHLFGILLPLSWMMRTRDSIYAARLRHLIVVFAVGAVLMQAGTRIVIDSVVALIVVIVESTVWHEPAKRLRGVVQLIGAGLLGVCGVLADSRLLSIAHHGAEGDGSFFARIYQSLDPLCGLLAHPWTLLTGYGAGGIADACRQGANQAASILDGMGMDGAAALNFANSHTPNTVWTMCAYTSFLAEYGLIGLALLIGAIIRHINARQTWNKTMVCWLVLVAYLYIQCENYAFAAIPLLIWGADLIGGATRAPHTSVAAPAEA